MFRQMPSFVDHLTDKHRVGTKILSIADHVELSKCNNPARKEPMQSEEDFCWKFASL